MPGVTPPDWTIATPLHELAPGRGRRLRLRVVEPTGAGLALLERARISASILSTGWPYRRRDCSRMAAASLIDGLGGLVAPVHGGWTEPLAKTWATISY